MGKWEGPGTEFPEKLWKRPRPGWTGPGALWDGGRCPWWGGVGSEVLPTPKSLARSWQGTGWAPTLVGALGSWRFPGGPVGSDLSPPEPLPPHLLDGVLSVLQGREERETPLLAPLPVGQTWE